MKATQFGRIVGASGLALAALAASAQGRPPTTEQLGRDPGALRQEAEQQRAQQQVGSGGVFRDYRNIACAKE